MSIRHSHHDLFIQMQHQVTERNRLSVVVTRQELVDVLPHYWREENVKSPEEWFIRMGRGLGFHITHQLISGNFVVRRTIDIADEATITWP